MEYDLNDFERKESDIRILGTIAKNQGFSDKFIGYVSEFIAERIEMMDKYFPFYSILETEIRKPRNLASCLTEKNSEEILVSYKNIGKDFLDLAGKLNDEKLAERAKQCFSSVAKCYKILINNLDEQNEDKRKAYKDFSEEYEFLSNNTFKLKEIISHYYKLRKRTNDLINEVNSKESINVPNLIDKILDNINSLKKLDQNSIQAQRIKKVIDEDSKFLPEGSYNKIKSLTNKLLSDYRN